MIRILIPELHKHRNETTFRPFISNDLFKDVGIEFISSGRHDMVWIGQASYMDKSKPYHQSIQMGIEYVEQFKNGDVILFDGQDSATLMGSWDVFKETDAKLLLKNTMYAHSSSGYASCISPNGRMYWANQYQPHTYSYKDSYYISYSDIESGGKFGNIKLSGTNWLSTLNTNWNINMSVKKDIDVFAMFQYPAQLNYEWGVEVSKYYTEHRRRCIDALKNLPDDIKVVTAELGKVSIEQYYELMSRSKIVIAPFGYGEIAPRDIESTMMGAVLIKPDMGHINTKPNIYSDPKNFISCSWDYSDLSTLILTALEDFGYKQEYYVKNMQRSFDIEYNPENLVVYTYSWINELEGYVNE